MSAPDFLDSNILVYAYDSSDLRKKRIAQDLVLKALSGEAVLSTQVLGEFAVTLLYKVSPRAPAHEVARLLDALAPIRTITPDADLVRRAVEVHDRYGVHFYDGLIIASAERGGCLRVLSEDMNAGQRYFGVSVGNPFQ